MNGVANPGREERFNVETKALEADTDIAEAESRLSFKKTRPQRSHERMGEGTCTLASLTAPCWVMRKQQVLQFPSADKLQAASSVRDRG